MSALALPQSGLWVPPPPSIWTPGKGVSFISRLFHRKAACARRSTGSQTGGGGGGGAAPTYNEIGSNAVAAQATLPITVTAVAINKRLCVGFAYEPGGGASVTSVTDSRGNTYAQAGVASVSAIAASLWTANAGVAIQGSDVITVNMSNGSSRLAGIAFWLDNIITGAAVDQTAGTTGTSTAPSSGATGATAQASEMAIGCIAASGASTFTAGGGYTKSVTQPAQGIIFNLEWLVLSATGAQTASGTLGTSNNWAALVVTLKGV